MGSIGSHTLLPGARYPMGIEPPCKARGTWPVLLGGDIYSARLSGFVGVLWDFLILVFVEDLGGECDEEVWWVDRRILRAPPCVLHEGTIFLQECVTIIKLGSIPRHAQRCQAPYAQAIRRFLLEQSQLHRSRYPTSSSLHSHAANSYRASA